MLRMPVLLVLLLAGPWAAWAGNVLTAQAAGGTAWTVAGRQGLIQVVIVPAAQSRDAAAYAEQIALLCAPGQTCFLNFFTNSTDAPLALPLPDAISHEATAIFRRSYKQGAEMFRWSCRTGNDESNCF